MTQERKRRGTCPCRIPTVGNTGICTATKLTQRATAPAVVKQVRRCRWRPARGPPSVRRRRRVYSFVNVRRAGRVRGGRPQPERQAGLAKGPILYYRFAVVLEWVYCGSTDNGGNAL